MRIPSHRVRGCNGHPFFKRDRRPRTVYSSRANRYNRPGRAPGPRHRRNTKHRLHRHRGVRASHTDTRVRRRAVDTSHGHTYRCQCSIASPHVSFGTTRFDAPLLRSLRWYRTILPPRGTATLSRSPLRPHTQLEGACWVWGRSGGLRDSSARLLRRLGGRVLDGARRSAQRTARLAGGGRGTA